MASMSNRVVGLVRVGKCERNITRALRTCVGSGIDKVIVVDEVRTEKDYANEALVKSKHVQIFCEKDMYQAQRRLSEASCAQAAYVLDVPPTFLHEARGLLDIMMQGEDFPWYRQVAVAPRYQTPDDYAGIGFLFLLTHLLWTFFGLANRWKSYRGTYAILRSVMRERGTATIAEDKPGPWRKMDGALFGPVVDVSPIHNFMYMMTREETGWRRWVLIFIYVRMTTFPWWALIKDPTQWKPLFPVPLIIFWILQALVALIYAHQYYPMMQHSLFHALVLPVAVIPWFLICIWAKVFWRGYQGTMPQMQWPSIDPPTLVSVDAQVAGAQDKD